MSDEFTEAAEWDFDKTARRSQNGDQHPMYELLWKLRRDLGDAQAKITAGFKLLDQLNLPVPERYRCESCGLTFRGRPLLAEHVYHSHAGPVPPHWEAIEARSDEAAA